jgi:hypothetical protein
VDRAVAPAQPRLPDLRDRWLVAEVRMTHKPDDVIAKDAGGGFAPHSEGQFGMLCVDVVDLGLKVEQFPGATEVREVPKVALVFASGEEQDGKGLTLVTVEMTVSANEKANLRKFVESWRGKSYTAEQAEAGVPITKLYGQAALVSIEHVLTRKGRRFAKITSVAPLPKAMDKPDGAILKRYERPKFLTDRKVQYAEAVQKHQLALEAREHDPEYPGDDDLDDLPF